MAFSIRLTEDERKLAESYAKLHSYGKTEGDRLVILALSVGHRSDICRQ